MPDSFSARLRQQREERGIDLIAIAERSKIKLSLLEGLERGDVSAWPSGIFRRAYIRTYAHAIGLEPDPVLREFLDLYPEPGDVFTALTEPVTSPDDAGRGGAPPTRLRTMVEAALGSLARFRRAGPTNGRSPASPGAHRAEPAADDLPLLAGPVPASAVSEAMDEGMLSDYARSVPESLARQDDRASDLASYEQPEDEDTQLFAGASPEPSVECRESAVTRAANVPGASHQILADSAQSMTHAALADLQSLHDGQLEAIAQLCTELGRASDRGEVQHLLRESAALLQAAGLILWLWDEVAEELRPALAHGYPERLLEQLPTVRRDADNATAAAFRSMTACEVPATPPATGALVVPLLLPESCAGVLAIELQPAMQPTPSLRAVATVIAAALAQLAHRSRPPAHRPAGDSHVPSITRARASLHSGQMNRLIDA